jgi:hypothetical protein
MVLPITFVKASKDFRASPWGFRAIATSTTICSDMNRRGKVNAGSLPTESSSALVSKTVIKLIVSLLGNPVHNLGGIVQPQGACSRYLRGGDVIYSVLSCCKGSVFRYTISLRKLVSRYGTNIGNLRSRMRIILMRSCQHRSTRGSILVRAADTSPIQEAARRTRAVMAHEIVGLTTTPVTFEFKGGVDILRAPKFVIHRNLFSEGLINPFMLFKFFYPEVFRFARWQDDDKDLPVWAALGHFLRLGTPLEMESEAAFSIHYRNRALLYGDGFEGHLDNIRRSIARYVPYRIVPFSEDNPAGTLRMSDKLTWVLQLNHPKSAILQYPGHYGYLTQLMSNHPAYKECHLAFGSRLTLPKRRSVPGRSC